MENNDVNNLIELGPVDNANRNNENQEINHLNNSSGEGLDLVGLATICFNEWNKSHPNKKGIIDLNLILIFLDAIGIKKNEYEIKNIINILNLNRIDNENSYTLTDFLEIVRAIRDEKSYIEEKLLAEAFSRMDDKKEGVLDFKTFKKYAKKALPKITDEEIRDIIDYFRENDENIKDEDRVLTYENFFKLYHEG